MSYVLQLLQGVINLCIGSVGVCGNSLSIIVLLLVSQLSINVISSWKMHGCILGAQAKENFEFRVKLYNLFHSPFEIGL
jgi:hypothetical protein